MRASTFGALLRAPNSSCVRSDGMLITADLLLELGHMDGCNLVPLTSSAHQAVDLASHLRDLPALKPAIRAFFETEGDGSKEPSAVTEVAKDVGKALT